LAIYISYIVRLCLKVSYILLRQASTLFVSNQNRHFWVTPLDKGQSDGSDVESSVDMEYNMRVGNSHLQWVQLGAWYCYQVGHCLICWVLVTLGNIGYEYFIFKTPLNNLLLI